MNHKNIYEQPARLREVIMSPVRQVMESMAALRAEGKDVISFSVGEPNFNTPEPIKRATIEAIHQNKTHYSSNRGLLELRREIAVKIKAATGLTYDADTEILVTSSGAEAINNAILGILNRGDEAVLITPSFVNYESLIYLCEATPVYLPLKESDGFQIDKAVLESKITEKTKLIIVNNPCNPSGVVLTYESLNKIAEVAVQYDLAVFTDEIYSDIVYEGQKFYSMAQLPGMKERTVLMNGFSKTYAMTGWRVGYLAMDQRFMANILRVHQYSTTTGVTFVQHGLAKTMNTPEVMQEVRNMVSQFETRRNLVLKRLSELPGLSFIKPYGAFYVMVNVSSTGMSGEEFSKKLLAEKYVAVVPAAGFGKEFTDYIRISYAASIDDINRGFDKIGEFLNTCGG